MEARTIADAFVYLLSRALVVRQEQIDRKEEGFAYNQIKYNPLGSADFVNPDFDVAHVEGWIAADDAHPVILDVPEICGRYYTAQIVDEWGELIANVNERTFPSKPFGKFALCKPGSSVRLRRDTARIDLHSAKAKLLGRIELMGDLASAAALQTRFVLTPQGAPRIAPPPDIPMFSSANLIGADLFDFADELMGSALDVSPHAAHMQQKVRATATYVSLSPKARQEVDKLLREIVIPEFKEFVSATAAPGHMGNYGGNYWLRAAANYAGIWANTADEVIHVIAMRKAGAATAKAM